MYLSGRLRTRRDARIAAVLLGLAAAAYTAWVLEAVISTGLDPLRTYVSELAAETEPLGGFFRTTDLVAGLLAFAGALWGLVRLRPHRAWARAGWAGLLLFGAATATDSRLPLACTPTADPDCAVLEAAGALPGTHAAHAVTSALAVTGAVVAMVCLTLAARRYRTWRPLARFGPWVVGLELAFSVWTLASVAAFEAGRGTWLLGLGQRAQVLLIAVWLGLFALCLARTPAPSGSRR